MEHSPDELEALIAARMRYPSPDDMRKPLGDREVICNDHGAYTSTGTRYMGTHEVWTRCADCEEARLAAERQEAANKKAEAAQAHLESMIEDARIPPRFIGRTFDNFHAATDAQVHALEVASSYAKNFTENSKRGNGLILSGHPGTGKSHLAAAILQFIMPDHCGLYTTCMNVIRAVRGTWRKDSERSESEILNAYAEVPLLVLDEIGVQYGTDGEQTILFDILDRRYRDMQPTILLTNQDKAGFKKFIGERSFDRLVESARWVSFDWESYRAQARKDAA